MLNLKKYIYIIRTHTKLAEEKIEVFIDQKYLVIHYWGYIGRANKNKQKEKTNLPLLDKD